MAKLDAVKILGGGAADGWKCGIDADCAISTNSAAFGAVSWCQSIVANCIVSLFCITLYLNGC